jgi:hypothetical protein
MGFRANGYFRWCGRSCLEQNLTGYLQTGIRLFERMLESSVGFPDQANKFPDGPT